MQHIRTYKDETWEWIEKKGSQKIPFNGKYLFFSPNRGLLINIAQQEISKHNFTCATVLLDPDVKTGEYILCIYDSGDQRERELAMRYANKEGIRYIGWIGKAVKIEEFFNKMCVEKKELF
jgi:hypothetical protein